MDVEKIVRNHIGDTIHLSLATCADGRPWVCEVHFAFDEELNLYFRSKPDRRHSQEIANNPSVAGNIVAQHELDDAVIGLYFEGTAEMLQDVDESTPAFVALSSRLGTDTESITEAREPDGHKFYKISVQNWYAFGRFGAEHGQKLSLKWKDF